MSTLLYTFMLKINKTTPDQTTFLQRLSNIAKKPKCLYYIGELPENPSLTVAIVGSRRPTAYGRTVTEQLASALAHHQVPVISGMALGIDALAHTATLDAGGQTIAVIPSGLDNPYPKTNQQLARRILLSGGALLSEYDAGYQPRLYDFLLRNRIVSGLCDALVVIEANLRSGTMSTVAQALDQGRTVYAVPGPITSPLSAGCNRLIAQGARPLTSIDSFLDEIGLSGQQKLLIGENDAEATLLQLLQGGISDGDQLLTSSGLDHETYTTSMTMLEIKGMIHAQGGNRWRL